MLEALKQTGIYRTLVLAPQAIAEVNETNGERTPGKMDPDLLFSRFGVSALLKVKPDISKSFVKKMLKKDSGSMQGMLFMHQMTVLSEGYDAKHPFPKNAIGWLEPIVRAIDEDTKNSFILENREIAHIIECFSHLEARPMLFDALHTQMERKGERLYPRPRISAKVFSRGTEDFLEHTYRSRWKRVNPLADGAAVALAEIAKKHPEFKHMIELEIHYKSPTNWMDIFGGLETDGPNDIPLTPKTALHNKLEYGQIDFVDFIKGMEAMGDSTHRYG